LLAHIREAADADEVIVTVKADLARFVLRVRNIDGAVAERLLVR